MILVYGVDGLSYRFCKEHEFFTKQGAFFKAEAVTTDIIEGRPYSGPNWTSIYTGLAPVDHGIIMNGKTLSGPTFADVRSSTWLEGENIVSFLMPFTWGLKAHGKSWIVPGFPCPTDLEVAQGIDLPEEFLFDIMDDRMGTTWGYVNSGENAEAILDKLVLVLGYHSGFLFRHAKDLRSRDIVCVGTKAADRVSHAYPDLESNGVLGIYSWLEQIFNLLVWMLKPDFWVVCGDHGFETHGGEHATDTLCVYSGKEGVEEEARPIWEVGQMIGKEARVPLGETVTSCHRIPLDAMKTFLVH